MIRIMLITSLFCINLIAKSLGPVVSETKDTITKNLKAMGYTEFKLAPNYTLEDCPHGHLNFSVHFKGKQFGNNKQGYFCYPYNHEQVVYYEGKARF